MSQIIHSFGLSRPLLNGHLCERQLSLAKQYYARLALVATRRRQWLSTWARTVSPEAREAYDRIARCRQALASVLGRIADRNAQQRRKKTSAAGARAAKKCREALWAAEAVYRHACVAAQKAHPEEVDRVNEACAEEARGERAAFIALGLYYGTYLLVEKAIFTAISKTKGEIISPKLDREWETSGVQIVSTRPMVDITTDTRVQIVDPPARHPAAWRKRGSNRGVVRKLLRLRIGTVPGTRRPIWVEWIVTLDRPLPTEGLSWVVVRRRQFQGAKWEAKFTIGSSRTYTVGAEHAAAVELGWRWIDGRILVARARGTDGERHALWLTEDDWWDVALAEESQSIADKDFDATKELLLGCRDDLSEPLRESLRYLSRTRSKSRLRAWIAEHGDMLPNHIRTSLQAWSVRSVRAEQDIRARLTRWSRRRKNIYCRWVCMLREKYSRLYVPDYKITRLRTKQPEDDDSQTARQTYQANLASPGLLREILVRAGAVKVRADGVRKICHVCSQPVEYDRAACAEHTCESCGSHWDAADNAAAILLARGEASEKDAATLAAQEAQGVAPPKPKKPGRFAGKKKGGARKNAAK